MSPSTSDRSAKARATDPRGAKGARTPPRDAPDPRQLAMEALLRQLDEHPGEPQHVPVSPTDVGGELLPLLSKGLYTNPLDAIREYVQNSVDAGAKNVRIALEGSSVQVFDDGEGMDTAGILRARRFGLSGKSARQHVGFRGIGIYSGFDLCQRLVIRSLREKDTHVSVLTFDFAGMRKQLEADRKKPEGAPKTALTDLLTDHTAVTREPSSYPEDTHFTLVDLQDLSDTHLRQLSNRRELRRYLLQNLPIDFSDDFAAAPEIRTFLDTEVVGYNAITVTLQTPGQEDEKVQKYAAADLALPGERRAFQPVKTAVIRNQARHPVAVVWSCLNTERARIQPRAGKNAPDDRPDYEGFVYKVKGFTIGDRRKLQFKRRPAVYPWYTGEVYVLDADVIPNAERDDFETTPARRALDLEVFEYLSVLERGAETFHKRGLAEEKLAEHATAVERLAAELDAHDRRDDLEIFSDLADIRKDLKERKRNVGSEKRADADKLAKRIDGLEKRIKLRTQQDDSETARRAEVAQRGTGRATPAPPEQLPITTLLTSADSAAGLGAHPGQPHQNGAGNVRTGASAPDTAAASAGGTRSVAVTILSALENAGWDIGGDVGLLAGLVQDALDEVLGPASPQYQPLLRDIAARVARTAGVDPDDV